MDSQITTLQPAIQSALFTVLSRIASFIPQLIGAGLVILVGYLLANWAKWLVIRIIHAFGLSKLLKDSPVDKFLEKAELTQKVEVFIGDLVRWFLLFVAIIAAVNILGLTTISIFLNNILSYFPRVLAAVLIFVVGVMIAGFVESLVKGTMSHISLSTGRMMSKMASYIVMVFTILAALAQLGIAENLIYILFVGFVAMLALGFGLAFGLGAKDLVAKLLEEWYIKQKKDNS